MHFRMFHVLFDKRKRNYECFPAVKLVSIIASLNNSYFSDKTIYEEKYYSLISFLLKERIGNKYYCPFFQPPCLLTSSSRWLNFPPPGQVNLYFLLLTSPLTHTQKLEKDLLRYVGYVLEMTYEWCFPRTSKVFQQTPTERFLCQEHYTVMYVPNKTMSPLSVHIRKAKLTLSGIMSGILWGRRLYWFADFPPTRIFPLCTLYSFRIKLVSGFDGPVVEAKT